MDNIYIVIPAFNEAKHIGTVVRDVQKQGYKNIVVVDDGSADQTAFEAEKAGAIVVKHMINLGPGAATQTGLEYSYLRNADIVVSIDGDGQHAPSDIPSVISILREGRYDIVFGSRKLKKSNLMPRMRKFYNLIANFITYILSSIWLSDSQSGFRVYTRKALEKIKIKTSGFEFCSEVLMQVHNAKLKYCEVPINVYYTKESMLKGQNFATGVNTLMKLFLEAITR